MDSTLGHRISQLRKKFGLSQAQLADKLGIATSTLGMYETNKREPSNETLIAISQFFHVTTDYLLNESDDPAPSAGVEPIKSKKVSSTDLGEMLDNARSFDGKPMDDHDREVIKNMLKGYYIGKEG